MSCTPIIARGERRQETNVEEEVEENEEARNTKIIGL